MKLANIDVTTREERGRLQMRQVRCNGGIPGVIYGRGGEARSLTLPGRVFQKMVLTHHKLFELQFKDGSKEEAFLQDMQWDMLSDELVHVDFKRIDLNEKMRVQVELRFVGVAKGIAKNGAFAAPLHMLDVECLPANLPEQIRVVVNDLDVGDTLHVKELQLPEGVVALEDGETVVCQVSLRAAESSDEEGEEAEGAGEPEVIGGKPDAGESSD